jgi:hypothetical protein
MALHPFQFFRKRQKTFLAILTILTMFIFILTGFSGSVVDRLGALFGVDRRKDPTEVTTLYGKTVTVGDLDNLHQDRRMADAFMRNAILSAPPQLSEAENQEVSNRLRSFMMEDLFGKNAGQYLPHLRAYQRELLRAKKTEAARFVQHELRSMELRGLPIAGLNSWAETHPGQVYFGGGTTPDDLLDFRIWQKQADKLNINLSDEDLRKAINHEADSEVLTGDPAKDGEKIKLYLQGFSRNPIDPKTLLSALKEEFRVRLAKEVLLGSANGARSAMGGGLVGDEVPAAATPEEFWEYYKDQFTELKVAFLKVPVSQFTDQVKKEPTQQELEDLFRRYKKDEPSPDRATPGFQVPRKVKVEWVAADAQSPHYQAAADKAVSLLNNTQALTLLTIVPAGVGTLASPVGVYASLALPSVPVPLYQFEYESFVKGAKSWWDASNITPEGDNPYATGQNRPDTLAAVAGQLIGSGMTFASPETVAVTLAGSIEIRLAEQKARHASMVLAGSSPFPLAVATQEAALANVRIPPLSAVRDDLTARLRNRLAPDMASATLQAFVKELESKKSSPKDAAEFIAKNANLEHGITGHGIMQEPRALADIAGDPALAPLRRAAEGKTPFIPSAARQFAEKFFTTTGPDGRPAPTQLFHPEQFNGPAETTTFYFWLTENEKPIVLSFDKAKPQVEAAWRFIQARKEARAAAEQIIEDLKKRGEGISPNRFLLDEAERLKLANPNAGYQSFDLVGITKLVRADDPFLSATRYRPYRFTETTIAYPRPDTIDELFKQLKQPGDAMVISDRPERNFFVAVLEERKVPTEKRFFDVYHRAPRGVFSDINTDTLWAQFQNEREQQYRTQVIRHLREEALTPLDEQGNYRIDPDVRRKIRGGPGGDE